MNLLLDLCNSLIRYKGADSIQQAYQIIQIIFYIINILIVLVLNICYAHQYFHAIVGLFTKAKKWPEAKKNHKYAYIVSARNESNVLPFLIDSIYEQDYPRELMQVFVVADNCTDDTEKIAQEHGAIVFVRNDSIKVGKSYALDYAFRKIMSDHQYDDFEAFFVFDADNLVTKNYTYEMNKLFDSGVKVGTSFRDSKNFSKNWLTAGQGMSFYRECLLLHHSRTLLGLGTCISGTGFFVKKEIIQQYGGWKFNSMVEDIEFSLNCAIDGIKVEYCESAVFYDEQPETLKYSLNQRLRWCKGTHQCCAKYDGKMLKRVFSNFNQTIFELMAFVAPLPVICFIWSLIYFAANSIFTLVGLMPVTIYVQTTLTNLLMFFGSLYFVMLFLSICCTIKYGKKMHATTWQKIKYNLTYPLFMAFFLPLSMTALFKKVKWTPIPHTDAKSIETL